MARPRKKVDEKLLKDLAFIHLPDEYIAKCLDVSVATLHRRFADKIEFHKSQGKAKLLSKAWSKVEAGEWPAIKFLLQNYLKMSEKVETSLNEEQLKNFTFNYNTKPMNQDEKG